MPPITVAANANDLTEEDWNRLNLSTSTENVIEQSETQFENDLESSQTKSTSHSFMTDCSANLQFTISLSFRDQLVTALNDLSVILLNDCFISEETKSQMIDNLNINNLINTLIDLDSNYQKSNEIHLQITSETRDKLVANLCKTKSYGVLNNNSVSINVKKNLAKSNTEMISILSKLSMKIEDPPVGFKNPTKSDLPKFGTPLMRASSFEIDQKIDKQATEIHRVHLKKSIDTSEKIVFNYQIDEVNRFLNSNLEQKSPTFECANATWQLLIKSTKVFGVVKIGLYLWLVDSKEQIFDTEFELRFINQISKKKTRKYSLNHTFSKQNNGWGLDNLLVDKECAVPANGFVKDDTLFAQIELKVYKLSKHSEIADE